VRCLPSIERFRLKSITIALFELGDRNVVDLVPAGTIIEIDRVNLGGNQLIEVIFNGKRAKMFTQDLRDRAEIVMTRSNMA
jgi:hypothetical protein